MATLNGGKGLIFYYCIKTNQYCNEQSTGRQIMNITRQTTEILTNFEKINSSILVKPGSQLETISPMKNILARANVSETFPQQFAIYDVKEFLRLLTSSAMKDAEIEFDEEYLMLLKDRSSVKYWYADETTVVHPTKIFQMPETEIHFELDEGTLTSVLNVASVLKNPDLAITSDGQTISLVVLDRKGKGKRIAVPDKKKKEYVEAPYTDFSTLVGEGNGDTYVMYLKTENIKFVNAPYDVSVSKQGISHFSNRCIDLEYWIALEPDLGTKFNGELVYELTDKHNMIVNKYSGVKQCKK